MEHSLKAYLQETITELRGWRDYASNNKGLIQKIKIAATVAPDQIKKNLSGSARVRTALICMIVLMPIFLLSLIGEQFSISKAIAAIAGILALPIIAHAAIRSAKRSTWELLGWIALDDPENDTGIAPLDFPVTAGVIMAPWIKDRNGVFRRIGHRLGKWLKRYIGVR